MIDHDEYADEIAQRLIAGIRQSAIDFIEMVNLAVDMPQTIEAANSAYSTAIGKPVSELTDDEKRSAFLRYVLEQEVSE